VAQDVGPEFKSQYLKNQINKKTSVSQVLELMPVILATKEAKIKRIMVRSQPQDPI
jgi:hypothetical protein